MSGAVEPVGYAELLEQVKVRVRTSRVQAARAVNTELAGPGVVVLPAGAPSPLQDVLDGILSVERRTQHLVAERPQPAAQPLQLLRRDRDHRAMVSDLKKPAPGPNARIKIQL